MQTALTLVRAGGGLMHPHVIFGNGLRTAAQCYNSAEKLARMGNFDNFLMEIRGCNYVHKCPGNMKQAMKKLQMCFKVASTQQGQTTFDANRWRCENNCVLSLLSYGDSE